MVTTDVIPILHVADAEIAVAWYGRLGFEKTFEHRFEPEFPAYVGIRREGAQMHLSEHAGDATAGTLVYVWVDDLDTVATEFGVQVDEQPWAREVELVDPDGNRLRVGQSSASADVDAVLGDGVSEALVALERDMWETTTRGDRAWMDANIAAACSPAATATGHRSGFVVTIGGCSPSTREHHGGVGSR